MQNISDALTTKTEYDNYIDEKTGQINLSMVCQSLSVGMWGLILAKARATFQISDLLNSSAIKSKHSKIVYLGLMIAVSQLLKYLADYNLVEMTANKIETRVDNLLNVNSTLSAHHGPMVQSVHVSVDEIVEKRQHHLQKLMDSGTINAWNQFDEMSKEENRFNPD